MNSILRIGAAVIAVVALAPVAVQAQAQAAAPADPGLGGPVVPGVCMISREGVLANSKVGVAAAARIRQLGQDAQAEIDAARKPLEAEAATLQAAKLTPEQRKAQEAALSAKFAPVQAKANLRTRELERTRAKAIDAIAAQTQPVIAAVYKEHGCGLLLDRATILGGNFANDLTPGVVKALDAKITALDIQRVDLSAEPAK